MPGPTIPMADPTLDLASDGSPGVPLAGPLYKDVKRQLMEVLTRGEWKAGEAIPSERRLAERYGISIGTVRKAIDELVAENILIRQQGRGTYVASHNRDRLLFYFFHIVPEQGPKEYPEIRLLSFARAKADRMAAAAARDRARRPGAAHSQCALARRRAGDHRRHHAPRGALPGAHREALPRPAIDHLQPLPGSLRHLGGADQRAAARRGRRRRTATLLGVARDAPLLQIRRLALTYNDVPVELRISLVNTARTSTSATSAATDARPLPWRATPPRGGATRCSNAAPGDADDARTDVIARLRAFAHVLVDPAARASPSLPNVRSGDTGSAAGKWRRNTGDASG